MGKSARGARASAAETPASAAGEVDSTVSAMLLPALSPSPGNLTPGPSPARRGVSPAAPLHRGRGGRRLVLLAGQPLVALLFELEGEVRAAGLDDAPLIHHVDHIRRNVVQDALVVRDDQHAHARATQRVHPLRDDAQRVDIQAGVGFVQDRHARLKHRHLQDLRALLLAAREPLVQIAADEAAIHLGELHLLVEQLAELRWGQALALGWGAGLLGGGVGVVALALGLHGAAQKVAHRDTRHRRWILEGEEEAEARTLIGRKLEQIEAIEEDLALGDHVLGVAHDDIGECALTRAVRTHQGMCLALGDGQVHTAEDLLALDGGMQVANDQLYRLVLAVRVLPTGWCALLLTGYGVRRATPPTRGGAGARGTVVALV